MAGLVTKCICGDTLDETETGIQCFVCHNTFHKRCVISPIDSAPFQCENCDVDNAAGRGEVEEPKTVPVVDLPGTSQPQALRRSERVKAYLRKQPRPFMGQKPIKTGSAVFVEELKTRNFKSSSEVLIELTGEELTVDYFKKYGFNRPIVIYDKTGLGIKLPPPDISWSEIEELVGANSSVDVINVVRQADESMKLTDFIKYMKKPKRTRILNVISLECSGTKLGDLVEPPAIAQEIDWVNLYWPTDPSSPFAPLKPKVQKYCLMAPKGAYTDFHIDFGGTSVWYHVLRGEKIFYLIQPTDANLTLFDRWMESGNRLQTFFADQVDCCYKVNVTAGTTVMLPTGWIHAVLTPEDSLVFGGNFLHTFNLCLQLRVNALEIKQRIAQRFLFPLYNTVNWFAGKSLCQELEEYNKNNMIAPCYLINNLKALLPFLKQWNSAGIPEVDQAHLCFDEEDKQGLKEALSLGFSTADLLRTLSRELRRAEKIILLTNPPKPERESKRKRKKPLNEDFLDYSKKSFGIFNSKKPSLPKRTVELEDIEAPQSSVVNPIGVKSIKLTVPKPAVYPYSSMPVLQPSDTDDEENWSIRNAGGSKIFLSKAKLVQTSSSSLSTDNIVGPFSALKSRASSEEPEEDRLTIDEDPTSTWCWGESDPLQKELLVRAIEPKDNKCSTSQDLTTGVAQVIAGTGIEKLLKASGFARGDVHASTGGTSPSTREAIDGMLSIGKMPEGNAQSSANRALVSYKEDEQMNNVYQDDDYVYPSLDVSTDEDDVILKPSKKKGMDEAWNPKAKIANIVPRSDRPARDVKRNVAVEKGLEAAASRKPAEVADSTHKIRKIKKKPTFKKVKVPAPSEDAAESASSSTPPANYKREVGNLSSSVGYGGGRPVDGSGKHRGTRGRRHRKGFATPKQRLSKILKIHKMIH